MRAYHRLSCSHSLRTLSSTVSVRFAAGVGHGAWLARRKRWRRRGFLRLLGRRYGCRYAGSLTVPTTEGVGLANIENRLHHLLRRLGGDDTSRDTGRWHHGRVAHSVDGHRRGGTSLAAEGDQSSWASPE